LPDSIKHNKEAVAETIENNMRRLIIDETPTNPIYFEKMSVLLNELIKERKLQALDYKKYLEKIVVLTNRITKPESSSGYPRTLNSKAKRALFDNLNRDGKLAIDLDAEILRTKKDDWRGNKIKEREVRNAIKKFVSDKAEADKIFNLVFNQKTDY
jgi:type I restriction enzyme, R subunit